MVKMKQLNRLGVISYPCELDNYVTAIDDFYLSFFNSFVFQYLAELQYEKIQILVLLLYFSDLYCLYLIDVGFS